MKLEQRLRELSEEEKRRVERALREVLESDNEVVFAYLHGSFLEGGPVRDVDVAVWLREGVDPLQYALKEGLKLELRLGLPVDVQALNSAPVTFKYVVYTKGLPIVVKDEELHDLEVAKTVLMYSDLVTLREKAGGRSKGSGSKTCSGEIS